MPAWSFLLLKTLSPARSPARPPALCLSPFFRAFMQHRYYGKSQPYGPDSVTTNPDVFSVQQAMAGELLPAFADAWADG